ncbi:acyl-CoA-binding protein [Dactylonectria macrodidyma]|uniref:Acyl-CoA-binding protein n=1 Tax=Dactylonectria macrodidyma TaxID=307937 RepID=A0A9P9JFQ1_9HYPO|nr:acyl-CoA-binding protein [Dactylonectria macrodidyma]
MATQSDAFKTAVEDSKKLTKKPSDDQLLKLYALYKVGLGEDFSAASAPGAFDFKGKYKYRAWKEVVEEGISAETAQERYVALVEELKAELGYDATKEPEAVGK